MSVAPLPDQLASGISAKLSEAYSLRVSDLKHSIRTTEDLIRQCQAAGLRHLEHTARNHLGMYYMIQGKFELAEQLSREALVYFESVKDPEGIADARYNIGGIYYRTNKYHQALLLLAESLKTYRDLEDYHDQARTLKSMGTIYEYFSDYGKAVESYEKSIEASRKIGNLSLESNALNPLSAIYYDQGKSELAMATAERSVMLKRETNDHRGLAFALYGRGKLLIKLGRYREAIADIEGALDLLEEAGDQVGLGMALNKLGFAYLELDELALARKNFLLALELSSRLGIDFIHFRVEYNLYLLAKKENKHIEALDYLEKYLKDKELVLSKESYNVIKTYDAVNRIEDLEREARIQSEKNLIIESKNAELDSFFYRVSHDLKGPISTLQGLHNIAELEVKDPTAMKYFGMSQAQVNRIHNIVISLIDLTQMRHLQNGKVVIDFPVLVDDCIGSCNYLENFQKVSFLKEIEHFEYASEWAIINTIIQNLIENAVKYSRPQDPFVRIVVKQVKGGIQIHVSDNGLGIDEEHQSKIFDMFYRASERSKGSGLGLYILKRAVERLDGNIELFSKLNEGSTFTVTLPA